MAIKRLGVGKSSVFLAMMCVATALIAEMMGREHLTTLQWLGVIIGVIGIILSQQAPRRKEKLEVAES
jgi:drug/metabolite transporter (DMT)-like permease